MIWLGFLALGPGVAFGLRYNHGVQLVASSLAYMATGFMMCVLSSIAMAGMAREIMSRSARVTAAQLCLPCLIWD